MDFQKRKSLADMNAVAIAAILRGESRRGAVLWMNMIEELQQWNKPPPPGTTQPAPSATTMFARHHHLHSSNNNSSRDGDACRLSAALLHGAFGTAAPPRPVAAAASSATATTTTRPDAAALPLVGITLDPLRHNIQDNLRVPLFNRVFLLPTSTKNNDDDDDDTVVSVDALQAILYYNLALWFHRQGLEVNRTKCLQQALYFYGQSYACLARCLQARANTASSWAALLLAAVYQNSQQVHAELCNFDHARRLRTLLGRVVTTTTRPLQHGGQQVVAWTEADYTTFHVGLVLGALDDFKLAPAA